MDKQEIKRQLDFLGSEPVKEWREKFPEKYEADVARLEAQLEKLEKPVKVELPTEPKVELPTEPKVELPTEPKVAEKKKSK